MTSPFIFFIFPFDWTPRDTDRYGFAVLRSNGFIPVAMTPMEYAACAITPRMIVLLVHYCISTWWVYRLVTVRKHPYALENLNTMPPIPVTPRRAIEGFTRPDKVVKWLFRRLPTRMVGVTPPALILCGGAASTWDGVML